MRSRRIYLDYASLTPIDRRVWREMKKYSSMEYANPSSWYKEGVAAKNAMDNDRKIIADFVHAHTDEIIFTSGGTEANNLAILGPIEYLHDNGIEYSNMHILASEIEHSSVLECIAEAKKRGVQTDLIEVDRLGIVKLDDLKKKIKANTVIVSIMTVNNETGVIQPIKEIAKIIRHFRNMNMFRFVATKREASEFKYPIFHTDAAQAANFQELNVEQFGVDLLTLDGSKIYGPRSIGALYIRRNIPIEPIIFGGGQEKGMRSGTENISQIMGFAKAVQIIRNESMKENSRINELKRHFILGLKSIKSDIFVHGENAPISPHIANVSIPGIDNEFFLLQLDAKGIACSTKSSCLRDTDESYVLKAMKADSKNSIRFSFGRWTKMRHIKKALKIILRILKNRV
jgi:cysteine desulfurase